MKSLPDIRNHLYDKSEKRWLASVVVTLVVQLLAVASVLVNNQTFIVVSGLASLVGRLAVDWLREFARDFQRKADKCRRLILYADGLNQPLRRRDHADLRHWIAGQELQQAIFTPPYYQSTLDPSPQRLVDITGESAYFTRFLSEKTADLLNLLFIVPIILLASMLYAWPGFVTRVSLLAAVSKAAAIIIAFLLSADVFLLRKQYIDLKDQADRTFRQCARLRNKEDLSIEKAMQVIEDYHLMLVESPPILSFLHKKYHDEINKAYRESHSFEKE